MVITMVTMNQINARDNRTRRLSRYGVHCLWSINIKTL